MPPTAPDGLADTGLPEGPPRDESESAPEGLADTEHPEAPPPSVDQAWSETLPRADAGARRARATTIGRYAILEVLGEGGMGTVYAVYDAQLDRKVALKLVKGASSEQARARMLREAQAMAKLSHPNVVPVFEVGEHEGELFIAMEFVQGRTLRQWVDERSRPWREIVEMYLQAGAGLAAAHAQELVHRDFKPDNAVVGDDERVRVLDFGLAAWSAANAVPRNATTMPEVEGLDTPLTATGAVLGTPTYMAVEQFMGDPVDHRTDQFALCVSLWEALYGARPFAGKNRMELFHNVSDGAVTAPTTTEVPAAIAALLRRGLSPDRDQRWPELPSLLDALRRASVDRTRRRRLVGGAVAVLGVAAGGVWAAGAYEEGQRQQRIAACERDGTDEIAAIWNDEVRHQARQGLLDAGVSYAKTTADKTMPWLDDYATRWQAARTEGCLAAHVEERWSADDLDRSRWCLEQRSMRLDALAQELQGADESVVQKAVSAAARLDDLAPCLDAALLQRLPPPPPQDQRDTFRAVRARLSRAATLQATARYDAGLEVAHAALEQAQTVDAPGLEAAARLAVGGLLEGKALHPRSEEEYETAYFLAAKAHAFDTAAAAAGGLAVTAGHEQARYREGRRWSRLEALALTELGIADDDLRHAAHLDALANILWDTGAYAEARPLYERALAINEEALGSQHPSVANSLNNFALLLHRTGKYAEARPLYERAIVLYQDALGPDHPNVANCVLRLADLLRRTGKYAQAKPRYERAVAIYENALGPEHPDLASTLNNFANFYFETGEATEAKPLYERAIAINEHALGPDHPKVAASLTGLANLLSKGGEHAQAKPLYERALAIREHALGPDHPAVADSLTNLAIALRSTGEYAEAKPLYTRALAIRENALGPDHRDVATSLNNLAVLLYKEGEYAEAQPLYERALAIRQAALGPDHPEVANSLTNLAFLLSKAGKHSEAQPLHERALAIQEQVHGPEHRLVAYSLKNLANLLAQTGEHARAKPLYERAVAVYEAQTGQPRGESGARFSLAKTLIELGDDRSRALAEARKAAEGFREEGASGAEALAEVEAWLARYDG